MDAIVEPRCEYDQPITSCSPPGEFNPACVHILRLGDDYPGMTYALDSGKWNDCLGSGGTVYQFGDDGCMTPLASGVQPPGAVISWGESAYRVETGDLVERDVWSDVDGPCEYVGKAMTRTVDVDTSVLVQLPSFPYSLD